MIRQIPLILLMITFFNNLSGQSSQVETVNFYDESKFEQIITRKANSQIDFVEYKELDGILKKIEFYDSKGRIIRDQIWENDLIQETKYKYSENNQIIKRYDVLKKKNLSTILNVNIKYPTMAMENDIQGVIEVHLNYDENCIPISYQILNKLGHGIDEEVQKKMELMIQLAKKYQVSVEECNKTNENFKVDFKLE